jgi:hypothetical protein
MRDHSFITPSNVYLDISKTEGRKSFISVSKN